MKYVIAAWLISVGVSISTFFLSIILSIESNFEKKWDKIVERSAITTMFLLVIALLLALGVMAWRIIQ